MEIRLHGHIWIKRAIEAEINLSRDGLRAIGVLVKEVEIFYYRGRLMGIKGIRSELLTVLMVRILSAGILSWGSSPI